MQIEQGKFPPPPGLVTSLVAGFDAVANHIPVILPPVVLDLFLWLGPQLRLTKFFQPFISNLSLFSGSLPANSPDIPTVQKLWTNFTENFNLFSILRTFPVGSSSLMGFSLDGKTPLGAASSLDAGSFFGILGWGMLLVLVGWIFGALYYYWVSGVTLKPEARSFGKSISQSVLLSFLWLIALFVVGIPVLILLFIASSLGAVVLQILLILGGMVLAWILMPVFFSAHGIFTYQQNAFRSIFGSLRMVRFTLPNTGLFLLVFIVIDQGLKFLWHTPPLTSWWMLVGIAGHAFVSTALLAASFVYYRDINAWLKVVFELLQKQTNTAKA